MMRRRTITLVVVGLALALFVVPAAASALIEDTEAEYELVTEYDAEAHVALYGIFEVEEDPDPESPCTFEDGWLPEGGSAELDDDGEVVFVDENGDELTVTVPPDCTPVLIEGPNGQVNHGQWVSNMVHAVKAAHVKDDHGPFGQWVKGLAQFDGVENEKADGDDGALKIAELDDDDDEGKDDGDGPPAHANENSKKPKKNK
jgi:hypothetical protein